MSCAFDNNILTEYLQELKRSSAEILPIKQAVMVTGRQSNNTWVFSEHVQISGNGSLLSESDDYVWIPRELLGENATITSSDVTPSISLPLSTEPLTKMVKLLRMCLKQNFVPALLVIGGTVMSFHYDYMVNTLGGCSVTVATGPAETGKSTAIRAGLSLFGCDDIGRFVKGTNAIFLERSSVSSLPYGIDDPALGGGRKGKTKSNVLDVGELIIDLYNGTRSGNMKTGCVKPRSLPIIATNFDMDDLDRVVSRALLVPFFGPPVGPETSEEHLAYDELERSLHTHYFSSAAGWVVSQGQVFLQDGQPAIDGIKEELRDSFQSLPRNLSGWATCVFFTQQLLKVANMTCLTTSVTEFVGTEVSKLMGSQKRRREEHKPTTLPTSHESTVLQTVREVIQAAEKMSLPQRLTLMRTNISVDGHEVLALWSEGVSKLVSKNMSLVGTALRRSGWGRTGEKKPLLALEATKAGTQLPNMFIKAQVNEHKRSCTAIFLDCLPATEREKIKELTKQQLPTLKMTPPTVSTVPRKELAGPPIQQGEMDDRGLPFQPKSPRTSPGKSGLRELW